MVCLGQEFRGIIYADSIETTQVNIVNLTQEIGSTNLVDGRFKIEAKEGDKIIFSSVQYQPYQVTVTQKMLRNEVNKIFLFLEINQLNEVNISSIDLTGDLNKDSGKMETFVFDPRSVGLPLPAPKLTTAQRRIHTATTGAGLVSVDHIINLISGRLAMLYRQRDYEIEQRWLQKGLHQFPPSFYSKELEIPEEYHEDFILFTMKDKSYKTLVENDKLALVEFFRAEANAYKKFKNWED